MSWEDKASSLAQIYGYRTIWGKKMESRSKMQKVWKYTKGYESTMVVPNSNEEATENEGS